MLAISNDELAAKRDVVDGARFLCRRCWQVHALKEARGAHTVLSFYRCDGKDYLGAINHKWIGDPRTEFMA